MCLKAGLEGTGNPPNSCHVQRRTSCTDLPLAVFCYSVAAGTSGMVTSSVPTSAMWGLVWFKNVTFFYMEAVSFLLQDVLF